jgi:ectoine hydroxylase-related dioxygenase (phytanoyl-CoA dioxygenase family)
MPQWRFCSGNTAVSVPGAEPQRQPVHSDADFDHPKHPFALVVNVPLITMTPENGSTEIWLGTHTFDQSAQEGAHGDRASGRIKKLNLDWQRGVRPPYQPTVKKGSIVIRDLRLWHAGMPNRTDDVRVMLAMIHFAPWYRNNMVMEFGEDVKPIIEAETTGLTSAVRWTETAAVMESYLNRGFGNSYDFDQTPL